MNGVTHAVPQIDDAGFDREIAGAGVVAVEFGAEWCAPCRVMAPVVAAAAQEFAGRVRIVQLDADRSPRTMTRYGVRGLPTVVVFREGREIDRIVGAVPAAVLRTRLERAVSGG